MTITIQQIMHYTLYLSDSAEKQFTLRSKHRIVRESLRKSIVISATCGIIHLN